MQQGQFRDDLLARINLWTFLLPGLRERPEDIEPNLEYELQEFARLCGMQITFNKEARTRFLAFGTSPQAAWSGNFRDLNGAVSRMGTLAAGGRITLELANEEIERLSSSWRKSSPAGPQSPGNLERLLGPERAGKFDLFDRLQFEQVLNVCRESRSLSEAGRKLFECSRLNKGTTNDADRLRKFLARFGLTWQEIESVSSNIPIKRGDAVLPRA